MAPVAGLLVVDFREKTLYFNHGFNNRGFSIGNSTFGSESSVSKGKSAIITVSGLSGPSGPRVPRWWSWLDLNFRSACKKVGVIPLDHTSVFQEENPQSLP